MYSSIVIYTDGSRNLNNISVLWSFSKTNLWSLMTRQFRINQAVALADLQSLIWITSSNKSFINNNISVCRHNKTTIRRIRNKSKNYFIIENIWKQL